MDETRYDVDHLDRESRVRKQFEEEAIDAKSAAIFFGLLHIATKFLHILSVTWATVVLLGGFAASLKRWDFFLVTFLLVAYSTRFLSAKAQFKTSAFGIHQNDKENILHIRFSFKLVNGILQCVCVVSWFLIVYRLRRRHSHPLSHDPSGNLVISLRIFYMLEFILSLIELGFVPVLSCLLCVHENLDGDTFAGWYFHEVLKETVVHGALKANEMRISDLAITKIADHIEMGQHPLEVNKYNERLIHYIYDQPRAVDRVCEYLKSENLWIRAAASSMPGFWVTRNKITLEKELFWRLRERMYGGGKDAECAISSAKLLAAYWVEKGVNLRQEYPFLVDDPVAGTNIVDTLVNIVLQRIRPTLLFQVKALAACCRHHLVMDHFYQKFILEVSLNNGNSEDILKDKVGKILQELIVGATNHTPASGRISAATRTAAPGQRGNDNKEQLILTTRLGKLCMKLCEIILPSNRSVQFVTKIYASEALLCLLLHDDTPILDATRLQLQSVVKDIIPSQRQERQVIDLEDIESMERVRQLLSLEQFSEWKMFGVSGMDEDYDEFYHELSQRFVEMKVRDARQGVAH